MMRNPLIFVMIIILTVSLACSVKLDFPKDEFTTGETVTEPVKVDLPDGDVEVQLTFGAGELTLSPGAPDQTIIGSAKYNVEDLKPVIETIGEKVKINTGNFQISGIPNFDDEIVNIWDLKLSNTPLELIINAGAYDGSFELGGLSITALEITDGASNVNLAFSTPNLVDMKSFRYTTGASSLELIGLANANFDLMTFRGGAGDFSLDFTGLLKKDATVQIESGLSHVKIIVPENTAARVVFRGGLASVRASTQWEKSDDEYTLKGNGHTLTIYIDMAAGDVELLTE